MAARHAYTRIYNAESTAMPYCYDICRYAIVLGWLRGTDILKHES